MSLYDGCVVTEITLRDDGKVGIRKVYDLKPEITAIDRLRSVYNQDGTNGFTPGRTRRYIGQIPAQILFSPEYRHLLHDRKALKRFIKEYSRFALVSTGSF